MSPVRVGVFGVVERAADGKDEECKVSWNGESCGERREDDRSVVSDYE